MPEESLDADDSRTPRLGLGVPRLDALLDGGLPSRSSTLVLGPPGSGKTMLGLHFLAQGVAQGEPGLYYGFRETRTRLVNAAAGVGLALRPAVESGRLRLEARAAVELIPDAQVHELLAQVERHGVRRLVLDGLEPLLQETLEARRTLDFLTALTRTLRSRGITSLLLQHHDLAAPESPWTPRLEGIESLVDNVVRLRCVELHARVYRMLSVAKMRESNHESALREFSISSRGLDVARTSQSAEAILAGRVRARPQRSARKKASRPAATRRRSRA